MTPECSSSLSLLASTHAHKFSRLGVPSMDRARVLFTGSGGSARQDLFMEELPSKRLLTLINAGSSIPNASAHRYFGGFYDFSAQDKGNYVAFVGTDNNFSEPLQDRFFGSYLLAMQTGTLQKIVDTQDSTPSAHQARSRRFHSVSAAVVYETASGTYAAFSGTDAPSGGRELVMRLHLASGHQVVLLDSLTTRLSELSAPQLCEGAANALGPPVRRWLLFFARHAGEPGVWSLSLDPSDGPLTSGGDTGAALTQLAGTATMVPGAKRPQTFRLFGAPVALSASSEPLAIFVAHGHDGSQGIYAVPVGGGSVRRLVDTQSQPDGNGQRAPVFGGFPYAPAASSGLIVFYATVVATGATTPVADDGLYAVGVQGGGRPWPVATLAGTNLTYLIARYDAFDGECLAFYGTTASSDGVYAIRVRPDE